VLDMQVFEHNTGCEECHPSAAWSWQQKVSVLRKPSKGISGDTCEWCGVFGGLTCMAEALGQPKLS
jgi:hypothetical protein